MKDPAYLEAVQAEAEEGAALDISSTPSVVVNGEVLRGVPEWGALKERIAAAASGTADGG